MKGARILHGFLALLDGFANPRAERMAEWRR